MTISILFHLSKKDMILFCCVLQRSLTLMKLYFNNMCVFFYKEIFNMKAHKYCRNGRESLQVHSQVSQKFAKRTALVWIKTYKRYRVHIVKTTANKNIWGEKCWFSADLSLQSWGKLATTPPPPPPHTSSPCLMSVPISSTCVMLREKIYNHCHLTEQAHAGTHHD